jgi:hypothetical protein
MMRHALDYLFRDLEPLLYGIGALELALKPLVICGEVQLRLHALDIFCMTLLPGIFTHCHVH